MLVIISYDIACDNRRARVHKTLKSFGQWVQMSVFECILNSKDYIRLRTRLEHVLVPSEDNIRFYTLCGCCENNIERIGGTMPLDEHCIFVS